MQYNGVNPASSLLNNKKCAQSTQTLLGRGRGVVGGGGVTTIP